MIYLLSEEIQSGKTTSLQLCTENRYDIGGFLSPDKNGIRCLMNLSSKEEIPFEIDLTSYDGSIEIIGKFAIAQSAFQTGENWIKEHLIAPQIKFIVIDEVGPLELNGKGFANALRYATKNLGDKHLIIVLRKAMHDKIVEAFELQEASILSKNGIDKLLASAPAKQ